MILLIFSLLLGLLSWLLTAGLHRYALVLTWLDRLLAVQLVYALQVQLLRRFQVEAMEPKQMHNDKRSQ